MTRFPRILAYSLALAALVLAVGCGRGPAPATQAGPAVTPVLVDTVRRATITDELVLTGTAQAESDSTLNPEMAGQITAVYVKIGDRVRRGQALLQMDTDLASAQYAQSAALVRSAQARAQQAQVGARLTDESTLSAIRQAEQNQQAAQQRLGKAREGAGLTAQQVENSIAQAQTGVQSAESRLADIRAGAREQELAQARAAVSSAEANLRLAQANYQRYQQLYDSGAIAAAQLDQYRTQSEVAQQQLDQARQALSLAQEGARTEQVRLAELGVDQARQQLQLAESQREQVRMAQRDVAQAESAYYQAQESLRLARQQRQQLESSRQEVQAAQAAVGQAQAGARQAGTSLSKHTISAPFDGVVAERRIEPGMSAGTTTALIRVVDLQPMKIQTQVSELQVDQLRVGMVATVSVDGLPGRTFRGRLARLSPASNPSQRMYTAEVEVENGEELVRPGMFCRVSLALGTVPDALVVSRDVLVESGEQRLVYGIENGKIAIRQVTIGAQSGNLVQVLTGVQEGEQLVVSGQSLLAAGQSVKPVTPAEQQPLDATPGTLAAPESGTVPSATAPATSG